MAFVNMFNDRVEQFNLREENERLAELFSDEKLQEEAQWQAYSVKEISRLFSISEEEALKLMNCGLFKTYRVGNEYRASKKSVEENKKIVKAVLTISGQKDNVCTRRNENTRFLERRLHTDSSISADLRPIWYWAK